MLTSSGLNWAWIILESINTFESLKEILKTSSKPMNEVSIDKDKLPFSSKLRVFNMSIIGKSKEDRSIPLFSLEGANLEINNSISSLDNINLTLSLSST